jgi:hypothetical protein
LLLQCYKDDKVNEDKMSGARGTYAREGKCMEVFCGNAEGGDYLEQCFSNFMRSRPGNFFL